MRISVFCNERVDLCVAALGFPEGRRDCCALEPVAIFKDACVRGYREEVISIMNVVGLNSLA